LSAALLLSLASAGSWAQNGGALSQPTALGCDQPAWDREARRYELEGETVLSFDLDDEGRPANARVLRSSGWTLLDAMSLRAIGTCRYAPPRDPATKRSGLKTAFVWTLDESTTRETPARFVEGSCPESDRFAGFRPLSGDVRRSEGLLVRFLVDPQGAPFGIKFEGDTQRTTQAAAEAYLAACRFTPSYWKSKAYPGNLFGRLLPKQA
jgi:TonB family protein